MQQPFLIGLENFCLLRYKNNGFCLMECNMLLMYVICIFETVITTQDFHEIEQLSRECLIRTSKMKQQQPAVMQLDQARCIHLSFSRKLYIPIILSFIYDSVHKTSTPKLILSTKCCHENYDIISLNDLPQICNNSKK